MTPKSIRSHLLSYSIVSKRKTTIAHAFASALAPSDVYDEKTVESALVALGQKNLKQLSCVYCEEPAQTWDHLESLVKDGKLNTDGYGHQIGNLVPCCRACNSKKGGTPFGEFVNTIERLNAAGKEILIGSLKGHLSLAKKDPEKQPPLNPEGQAAQGEFWKLQDQILDLMEKADECVRVLRSQKNG